jgi:hypothetical protein
MSMLFRKATRSVGATGSPLTSEVPKSPCAEQPVAVAQPDVAVETEGLAQRGDGLRGGVLPEELLRHVARQQLDREEHEQRREHHREERGP